MLGPPYRRQQTSHPLSKLSCSQLTQPGQRHSHPIPVQLPPTASGPSVMLLCSGVGGQSERGFPTPQGTAQQFQKNRDLYFFF